MNKPCINCCTGIYGLTNRQPEGENTYATLVRLLNKDSRLNLKVARGYLEILRQERPVPADFDLNRVFDPSFLPVAR